MKSISTNKRRSPRSHGIGRVRLASAVRPYTRITTGRIETPTSRHMTGVWEDGSRLLKPKGAFWTDAELLALGTNTDVKYELWDGKIIPMSPARPKHGAVIARLTHYLTNHIYEHKLGEIFDGQTGFRLGIEHCFQPDISFVSGERMKLILPQGLDGMFQAAPDIAIEVLSPSDSFTKVEKKMQLYLAHGARLGWMVDTKNKTIRVYRPGQPFELLRSSQLLSGNSVLPGFRISLAKIFESI
ncbi:MAG TPA: Uma2 family endonuclease [Verrucomicrobiae bacterium]|nr:Uma2 family endonuclease [Verrucomicrobiae bacterium]